MRRKIRISLVILFSPLIVLFPFVCYLCPIPIFLGLLFMGIVVAFEYVFKLLLFDNTENEKRRYKEEIIGAFQMMFSPFIMTYIGIRDFIDPPEKTSRW